MESVDLGIKQRDVSFEALENKTFEELENTRVVELQDEYFVEEKKDVELKIRDPFEEVSL